MIQYCYLISTWIINDYSSLEMTGAEVQVQMPSWIPEVAVTVDKQGRKGYRGFEGVI